MVHMSYHTDNSQARPREAPLPCQQVTHADRVLPQLPPPMISSDCVRTFSSADGYLLGWYRIQRHEVSSYCREIHFVDSM